LDDFASATPTTPLERRDGERRRRAAGDGSRDHVDRIVDAGVTRE
jgi:hypothetical protein